MIQKSPLLATLGILALAGCAAPNWQHTQRLHPDDQARRLAIDTGYCTQVASGSAPMPAAPAPGLPPQAYAFQGSASAYGPAGASYGHYSGTVTPVYGAPAAFANGMAQGMGMGAMMRAKRDRDAIHRGCMMSLGWADAKR